MTCDKVFVVVVLRQRVHVIVVDNQLQITVVRSLLTSLASRLRNINMPWMNTRDNLLRLLTVVVVVVVVVVRAAAEVVVVG